MESKNSAFKDLDFGSVKKGVSKLNCLN